MTTNGGLKFESGQTAAITTIQLSFESFEWNSNNYEPYFSKQIWG